jgi:hypothetical protein
MLSLLYLLVIFYSALVLLVLRKWGIKGFVVYFVITLVIMILITSLSVTMLLVIVFMLLMGSGTALLFHLIEDNETERKYTLLISGLSAFFGGISLLPSLFLMIILSCFIDNTCM